MGYHVYILKSEKKGRYYIGYSQSVGQRLEVHNRGGVRATRYQRPFQLVHVEDFDNGQEARKRERELKRQKSRRVIDEIVAGD